MRSDLVLLTGASGFVGRQVLKALHSADRPVRIVVRDGKQELFSDVRKIESIVTTLDLHSEDFNWWKSTLEGVDTIIHAAWNTEPGLYLQSSINLDWVITSIRIAKAAKDVGVRRFVGIGTCFEYDFTNGLLDIRTPLNPQTPYAAAKSSVYSTLSQWLPIQGIEFAWCRLFYLFGEGENFQRLVPYLRTKLAQGEVAELTSGKQVRDFLDIERAGQIIADIAISDNQGAFNVCSGIPISVRALAERIADEYNGRHLLRFGARKDNLVDPPCIVGIPNFAKRTER